MQRIVVIGTTGSGKTTLAGLIAAHLGCPHIELDALHWEPDWQEAPLPLFRERVAAAVSARCWVVDGNYSKVRDLIWPVADTIVWLDYPFLTIFWRLLSRTVRRIMTREPLWNNNRESLEALLGKESIMVWMFKTYWRRKREFPALFQRPEHSHLQIIRQPSPQATQRWLATLPSAPDLLPQPENA